MNMFNEYVYWSLVWMRIIMSVSSGLIYPEVSVCKEVRYCYSTRPSSESNSFNKFNLLINIKWILFNSYLK